MYPVFWKAGGGPLPHVWGFGYWSSGPESPEGDGLLTYHNLEGESEKVREMDLVELQDAPIKALLHWIYFRGSCNIFRELKGFHGKTDLHNRVA